ncbi:gsk3b-interacting protein [Anaeramoeba ignava]|uniref:Gsk3b-interacting protein n=1 Tax=Anaeramoeba ignava TaxID=1746090 RepID=A0A9Q0L8H7_ANAIG|nr:gsk3b-interacting protein [Anaeramoeba ignava]
MFVDFESFEKEVEESIKEIKNLVKKCEKKNLNEKEIEIKIIDFEDKNFLIKIKNGRVYKLIEPKKTNTKFESLHSLLSYVSNSYNNNFTKNLFEAIEEMKNQK